MPLGPNILCPEKVMRSMLSLTTSVGIFPTHWVASVEDHVAVVAERADLGHLVDGADPVVGPHDGDEDVVAHRLFDLLGGDDVVAG